MRIFLGFIAALLLAAPAWGQTVPSYNQVPTCSAVGTARAACGAVAGRNSIVRFNDSFASQLGSVIVGGGAHEVVGYCEGTTCWTIGTDDGTVSIATLGTTGTTFTIDSDGAPGAAILDTASTGTITIGSADVASVTIETDGLDVEIDTNNTNTMSLENSVTGSVILDFRDYADTTDDDMAHAVVAVNCTTTSTGAEDCDLQVQATEAGVGGERMLIDGDGDTVFPPERPDGGNGNGLVTNPQRRINGIPKICGWSAGVGKVNTGTINTDFGDSETPDTDWTQTANMTTADETTIIRMGTGSLKVTVGATPADGNGVDNTLASGNQNWTGNESFGMWMRCDTAHSAGDWVLEITDSVAGATEVAIPAQATTDTWDWLEVDISGVADASKDAITDLAIDLSAAGATTFAAGGICYFDYMWKWDASAENAIGKDVYEDGILSVFSVITAGAAITPILEVEGTDWFGHYEAGNDFIVSITDLSADSLWGQAALE